MRLDQMGRRAAGLAEWLSLEEMWLVGGFVSKLYRAVYMFNSVCHHTRRRCISFVFHIIRSEIRQETEPSFIILSCRLPTSQQRPEQYLESRKEAANVSTTDEPTNRIKAPSNPRAFPITN